MISTEQREELERIIDLAGTDDRCESIEDGLRLLESVEGQAGGWVRCSERVPDNLRPRPVIRKSGGQVYAVCIAGKWWMGGQEFTNVVVWLDMPTPPGGWR